ncbi:MAG: protein-glutamate O-methyltransferase CheR [Bacteroidetes bacterium]|nr:protein-glutamate O-methyltransferase CheR [Bacteroidota bacterium]
MNSPEFTDEELNRLVINLEDWYGYNFSNYARASFKRRVSRILAIDKLKGIDELSSRLKQDGRYVQRFIEEITVNVTEMYRDPSFYKTIRDEILPALSPKPFIRIWHAGCSTGEEVYSMAIMLKEMNLLHRSMIYATDISAKVLASAKEGRFPLQQMKLFSENYLKAGGRQDFSSYYSANYGYAKFDESLKKNILFASHNLVSDGSFNEFQLLFCRNVLIYFDRELQNKVLSLFDASIEQLGFLALGSREHIKFSGIANRYTQWNEKERIWRKRNSD